MGNWNPFKKDCKLEIPYGIESPMTELLIPGDVILYRALGHQVLGGLITEVTDSPYSHSEVYAERGWSIEAGGFGVSYADGFHNYPCVDVLRWKGGLTDEQKAGIVAFAASQLGDPYDYGLLFGFPFISRRGAAQAAANHAFICSEIVAWAYAQNGLNSCNNDNPTSVDAPADFGLSKNFEWLGMFNKGARVDDARRNEWHLSTQGKRNWLADLIVDIFAEPFSRKDEYYKQLKDSQSWLTARRLSTAAAKGK